MCVENLIWQAICVDDQRYNEINRSFGQNYFSKKSRNRDGLHSFFCAIVPFHPEINLSVQRPEPCK